jgi:RHS repeat-associated protein
MSTGGADYYYQYDLLGSVTNLTSETGTTEWTYGYEPFGATRTQTKNDPNAPVNPMTFAGEYTDSTGLYDLRARQYDATTGRFLQIDPLPSSDAAAYVYVADKPTVMVDPTGKTLEPVRDALMQALHVTSREAFDPGFGSMQESPRTTRSLTGFGGIIPCLPPPGSGFLPGGLAICPAHAAVHAQSSGQKKQRAINCSVGSHWVWGGESGTRFESIAAGSVICGGATEMDGRISLLGRWSPGATEGSDWIYLEYERVVPRAIITSSWLTSMMSVEARNADESETVLSEVAFNWVTGERRDTAWPPAA